MLVLPLLSSCEPCECQPTVEEPVVNCYTVRYEATGTEDYNLFNVVNSTGGLDFYNNAANSDWNYEFEACTGQYVGLALDGPITTISNYSIKIYLDDVLFKEANGTGDLFITQTPLP